MIRKHDSMNIEVLNDNGFGKKFQHPDRTAGHWKDYKVVQTCLKSKLGLGQPIYVKFYADVNFQSPSEEIKYDFKAFGDDVHLI